MNRCGACKRQGVEFYPSHPWICKDCAKQRNREWARKKRQQRDPVDLEKPTMLPPGPFLRWMEQKLAEVDEFGRCMSKSEFAERAGYSKRSHAVNEWRAQAAIGLDVVDRVLCAFGEPGLLREMYPALYVFDEAVAA